MTTEGRRVVDRLSIGEKMLYVTEEDLLVDKEAWAVEDMARVRCSLLLMHFVMNILKGTCETMERISADTLKKQAFLSDGDAWSRSYKQCDNATRAVLTVIPQDRSISKSGYAKIRGQFGFKT